MSNIVRIVIFTNRHDYENNYDRFNYIALIPDILATKPEECYYETKMFGNIQNDKVMVLLSVSGVDKIIESSGVWGAHYFGHEPTEDEVYEIVNEHLIDRLDEINAHIIKTEPWYNTHFGFSFRIAMSEEIFDQLMNEDDTELIN